MLKLKSGRDEVQKTTTDTETQKLGNNRKKTAVVWVFRSLPMKSRRPPRPPRRDVLLFHFARPLDAERQIRPCHFLAVDSLRSSIHRCDAPNPPSARPPFAQLPPQNLAKPNETLQNSIKLNETHENPEKLNNTWFNPG